MQDSGRSESPLDWAAVKVVFDEALDQPPDTRASWLAAQVAAGLIGAAEFDEVNSLLAHQALVDDGADALLAGSPDLLLSGWTRAGHGGDAARDALDLPLLHPGLRLGAWEIVDELGRGGMAEVWRARRADGAWEGEAAIKVLQRGMDSGLVLERFALEQRALARLAHPHIARLLDAGRSPQGLPYFVMELVHGQPIDQACTGLSIEQRLALFLQLADAVAFAHRQLLVHRDLKPSNVMVTPEGQVRLLDFGIAKALDPLEGGSAASPDLTQAGQRPYTPNYASPEQARGEWVGTGTDIYSLGVLLYVMLTGLRPYGRQASTPQEAVRSLLEDDPTRPSALSPQEVPDPNWLHTRKHLRGDLDNILLKALEKAPERRYPSVDAFAQDVRAYLEDRPVSAHAPSAGYLLARFVRRNRLAVSLASLALVGVLGGAGVATWQGRQATLARDLAQRQLAGVKHMSTDLVFRYGDALANLPGGASAQEEVLKQTLSALDEALASAPGDADLTALVASVLGRLAQLQSNPTFSGPERASEAAQTVERSLALGEAVWASHFADWRFANQHLITLMSRAQLLRNQVKPAEGLAVLTTAEGRSNQVLATALPEVGRAAVLDLRANIRINMAQFNDHAGRPSLNKPQEALRYYALAEQDFRSLYDDPALVKEMDRQTPAGEAPAEQWGRHNLGNVHTGRAMVYQRLGNDEAMRADLEAALALRRANVVQSPKNVTWRQSLMFDLNSLSIVLLRQDQGAAALAASSEAWSLLDQLMHEAGAEGPWAQSRANFSPHYGRALASQGQHSQALAVFDFGIQGLSAQLSRQPTPNARQRLAWLQILKARSLAALSQWGTAHRLAAPAMEQLDGVLAEATTPAPVRRDTLLARAEGAALLAEEPGAAGRAAWRQQALADLEAAAGTGPLSALHQRLQRGLSAP